MRLHVSRSLYCASFYGFSYMYLIALTSVLLLLLLLLCMILFQVSSQVIIILYKLLLLFAELLVLQFLFGIVLV